MATKIFATGTTGYIGGDALHHIVDAHPEYEIACLVRSSDKGAQVASQFVKIRLVYGSLDDAELLEEESKKADIVLHFADCDHEVSAKAIVKGLATHPPDRSGYLIHTSGTGILMFGDMELQIYGEASSKVYDDWEGISEVTSIPDYAPHRKVDKIVLAAGDESSSTVKTAIVCPPTIYGQGRGPGNQRGDQIYHLARAIMEDKQGFQVGAGEAMWNNVHISDLSDCYLKLVEAAVQGGGKATWGKEGYYFTENGEHAWGQVSRQVASAAYKQGFLPSDKVVSRSCEEAQRRPDGTSVRSILWGANSRGKAIRARKVLGWLPKEKSMEAETLEVVSSEAKIMGLVQGHAAKVAG